MLVAVAAMAFTACQKDNNEVNKAEQKTVITGVATIENDDTRSGFVGSTTEDGKTMYHSEWDGGENLKVFINYGEGEATTTIDKDGNFTFTYDGDAYIITVCSPAEAWLSEYTCSIPSEQTPRANSVDPAAHILKAQAVAVTDGVAECKMQHEVSYGKMTVNTPADFEIAKVVVNLVGDWYGYARNLTYTLNATNVENNTFYFATETINVSEFTITAYDANENAYSKTVTLGGDKTLKFDYYKVSTFSVSELTAKESSGGDDVNKFTSASVEFKDNNWPTLTFTDNHDNVLKFRIGNGSNTSGSVNYWTPGTWSTDYWYSSGYAVDSCYYNDTYSMRLTADVSVVDNAYKVTFNWDGGSGSFNGQITGFTVPSN